MTQVIKVDPSANVTQVVKAAADLLAEGRLVVFPTETVYGLAARADCAAALQRLRASKGRSTDKPFTVHIGSSAHSARFLPSVSGLAKRLMAKGWPGPLPLILPVARPADAAIADKLDNAAQAELYADGWIGLRCPDDPIAGAILSAVDAPVVAASANRAGKKPPRTAGEVIEALGDDVDLVVDAGPTRYAKASTIVRVDGDSYEVLRDGVFDASAVARLAALRLLFVCTGNTCRSPMAAALAKQILAKRLGCRQSELEARGIVVDSAGTAGGFGRAHEYAIAAMAARGIDIRGHVSRHLDAELLGEADHVLVMTGGHRAVALRLAPTTADRVKLLLGDEDVHDPIGGTRQDYESCAATMGRGLRASLSEVNV